MELGTICHTVEPVYKDHQGNQENVVFVDRWSPYRGVSVVLEIMYWIFQEQSLRKDGLHIEVVFVQRFYWMQCVCVGRVL